VGIDEFSGFVAKGSLMGGLAVRNYVDCMQMSTD
jgi:hypothetical protein